MTRLKGILACTFAATGLLCGGQASAALLQIGAGTSLFTPASNNVLGSGVSLIKDAALSTTGAATLTFFFLGSESGFTNTLNLAGGLTHAEPPNGGQTYPSVWPGSSRASISVGAAGAVPMWFTSSGWTAGHTLAPGSSTTKRSIALAYLNCTSGKGCAQTTTPTDIVLFALDDGGAGPDKDFDDYVGYLVADASALSPVPLPASVWLLGSALVALFGMGRRRRAG